MKRREPSGPMRVKFTFDPVLSLTIYEVLGKSKFLTLAASIFYPVVSPEIDGVYIPH